MAVESSRVSLNVDSENGSLAFILDWVHGYNWDLCSTDIVKHGFAL